MESSMELSIVVPVYNGESSVEALVERLYDNFKGKLRFEVVLVNDFSPDNSWAAIQKTKEKYPHLITAINLRKNFGEHNAVMAGYAHAKGQYIVNIDDDFQNPPEEIDKLLDEIKKGYDVVYSYYRQKKHHFFRNLGSKVNDFFATLLLKKPKNLYLSSFRIINKELKDEILSYKGPFPYIDGLILRSTAHISQVEVIHNSREEGESNYTFVKLLRLWSYMALNFSVVPLRVSTFMGIGLSVLGAFFSIWVFIEKLLNPEIEVGWSSTMISILISSGVQLFILGLIGEYVGRIFITQNSSPQYSCKHVLKRDENAGE